MAQPVNLDRSPSKAALERLCELVARGSRPANVRRLRGGIDTSMHAFDLVERSGMRRRLVLKRFDPRWTSRDLGIHCRRVTQTLAALEQLTLPAPRPVWSDPEGSVFGTPAIVMTRVPGRVVWNPSNPEDWANQLATTLAALHRTPLDCVDLSFLPDAGVTLESRIAAVARDAVLIDAYPHGPEARELLQRLLPRLRPVAPVLTHGDFYPGNVLWTRGRLQAIVDWDYAALSAPDVDVAKCCVALATQHSEEAADSFLRAYEAASGQRLLQLHFWDLLTAVRATRNVHLWAAGMHDFGRPDATGEWLSAGLERFMLKALAAANQTQAASVRSAIE